MKHKSKQKEGARQATIQLPKNAISRVDIGHAFAEYDLVRQHPYAFVKTPAMDVALNRASTKRIFVGRRGTGKTAMNFFVLQSSNKTTQIIPQIFDLVELPRPLKDFLDTRQRPFKSLVSCFCRTLQLEVIAAWLRESEFRFGEAFPTINRERDYIENYDFDLRLVQFIEETFKALSKNAHDDWIRLINRVKNLADEMRIAATKITSDFIILIDRVDECWRGTDEAVVLLMALMHACMQMLATNCPGRSLLFLRENIFERVRQIDNEFARLETAVISLDWTYEQLREMIERRLNLPFSTKLALGGQTWAQFFGQASDESEKLVFDYCQRRPRDVLIYCSFAVAAAQAHKHEKVQLDDLHEARRRFSDSRLKDLGDEYSENFPNIGQVIKRFYGLGRQFKVSGIEALIKKLLIDEQIKRSCASWIYLHTTPDMFITLLYNIGFIGIETKHGTVFRTLGPETTSPPPITAETKISIHPTYWDALNLRDEVIVNLLDDHPLQVGGVLDDFPEGTTLESYQDRLNKLKSDLETLPTGRDHASAFEEIVGEIVRLCFFRSLANLQPRVRNLAGTVVRDWVAANRASEGFWRMIRERYQATQVVWECKNFEDLDADVFQQGAYYMTEEMGRFIVIAFRGNDTKKHYFQHVKDIARQKRGGITLLVNERDLKVFLRQAINGKVREEHIHELYDRTVREIS